MTFNEWWAQEGHSMWLAECFLASQVAREAWQVATAAAIERCAKACDGVRDPWAHPDYRIAARDCAAAIRALQEPQS